MGNELDERMEEAQKRFWNNFTYLCKTHHESLRGLTTKLGIATSPITKWKNGAWPDTRTLTKIADYFDITLDELLGNYDRENGAMLCSYQERKIILAYRSMNETDKQLVNILVAKYED